MPFDPSNAQLYAPGTTVGGMPGTGGYAPTTTDMMLNNMRMQQDARMQSYLLQNDQRALYAAQLAAQGIAGKNAGQWYGRNGQMASELAGMAINNQMMAGIMGGSILDMYGGVNTAMAASGFQRMKLSGGGSTYFGGAGYVNDQISRIMTMRMQDNFFTDRGGAWLHKTSGLNRSDLGELVQYMGMGGAFAGNQVNRVVVNNEQHRQQLLADAIGKGNKTLAGDLRSLEGADWTKEQNVLDVDKSTTDRINRKIELGAKALGAVKDIFGQQGVPKLMQIAKEISGMDISTTEGSREIVARMGRIKNFASMHGMSAEAVGMEQATIASAFGGGKYGGSVGEQIQGIVQMVMDNSRHRPDAPTRDQVTGAISAGVGAIDQEGASRVQVAAAYRLYNDKGLSGAARARLRQGLAEIENAGGDMAKRNVASFRLNQSLVDIGGVGAEETLNAAGGYDQAKISIAQPLAETRMLEIQRRARDLVPRMLEASGLKSGAAKDFMESAFKNLSSSHFEEISRAMKNAPNADNIAKIKGIINDSELDDDTKKRLLSSFEGATGDKAGWAKGGMAGFNLTHNNATQLLVPLEGLGLERQGALGQMLASDAFGDQRGVNPNDLISNIMGGLMGQKLVNDQAVMTYGHAKGQTSALFKVDPKTKKLLEADQAGLAKLMDKVGDGLDAEFGLEGSKNGQERAAKLAEMFKNDPGNINQFFTSLKSQGYTLGRGADDKLYAMSEDDVKAAHEVLDPAKEQANFKEALGKDYMDRSYKGLNLFRNPNNKDAAFWKRPQDTIEHELLEVSKHNDGPKAQAAWSRLDRMARMGYGNIELEGLDMAMAKLSKDPKKHQNELQYLSGMREELLRRMNGGAGGDSTVGMGQQIISLLTQILKK